jgi:Flp pilus assembly protein TadG
MKRSFRACTSGAAALEFALIAPLFLAITFSCLEGGLYMTRSILLDRAMSQAIRLIRVDAKDAPRTQPQMKAAICKGMMLVDDCVNAITVEMTWIETAADFPTADMPCVDRGQTIQPTVNFTAGKFGSIMYVRACLVSDPLTPGLGFALQLPKDTKGGYGLRSASAYMTEDKV